MSQQPGDRRDTAASSNRRPLRLLGVAAVALVVLGVAVVAWYLNQDAPGEVDVTAAVDGGTDAPVASSEAPATGGGGTAGQTEPGTDATITAGGGTVDGAWTVDTQAREFDFASSSGTFVGFRVEEELSNIGETTAVGRTPEVSGSVEVSDGRVTATEVEAELTALTTDRERRDDAVQRALNTSEHPTATFLLTEPIDIGSLPEDGGTATATAVGELRVAGETRTVEIPLEFARAGEDLVAVGGSTVISLADFGVEAPSAPIVLSVSDEATVELQLFLTPA